MASSPSTQKLEDAPKSSKKGFFSFLKKKSSKQQKKDSASKELIDRVKFDNLDYKTAQRESQQGLIALAYKTTTRQSFRDKRKTSHDHSAGDSSAKNETNEDNVSENSGRFPLSILTRTSFFRKICNDAFDTIDVDQSGKINESELYQGLLLIHLKLGLYFGPAACKPISLDRTKFIFNKLDTNMDGSLDKGEFQRVLALLMGNVMSRILFQFICTLLIVPFLASTILEKTLDGYGFAHGIVMESWLPTFHEKYQPLLEVALGFDLLSRYASVAYATAIEGVRKIGIADIFFYLVEGPVQFIAEKYDAFVLQPINGIAQETWDSLPLTFLSTILTLIIVPYSIVKTDDFFRFLAEKSGGKGGSTKTSTKI